MSGNKYSQAGWYDYPSPPAGVAHYQVYWDGQAWTDQQRGLFPEPDRPGLFRYFDGEKWGDQSIKAVDSKTYASRLSRSTAVAETTYLDPQEVLSRSRTRGNATTIVLIIPALLWVLATFYGYGYIVLNESPSLPEAVGIFFGLALTLLIPGIALYFLINRLLQWRETDQESFLCSVNEAAGLPEGVVRTVSGIAGSDHPFAALGRSDCVYYSFKSPLAGPKNKEGQLGDDYLRSFSTTTSFYLSEGESKIWCYGGQVSCERLQPIEIAGQGWAVFAGDEISLTGTIKEQSDGRIFFTGPVYLNFPVNTYSRDLNRLTSAADSDSAAPRSKGPIGPARIEVLSYYLAVDLASADQDNVAK